MLQLRLARESVIRHCLCTLTFLALSGCFTLSLTSRYDEVTDKELTALQQSTDDFIVKLATEPNPKARAFETNQDFYTDADKQIRHLEFRVNSIPDNAQTIKLVKDIRAVILGNGQCSAEGASLRDLHCMPQNLIKGPSTTSLTIQQRNINQTIGAALALEIAKKQGLESAK